jgi:plastocyanin
MQRIIVAAAGALSLSVLLAGCGGSSDHSTGPTPDFSVSASTVAPTTLGTVSTINVSITSTGASGQVALAVTGAPSSWSVGFPSTTLTANSTVMIPVTVTIPSNGDAATTGRTLTVNATVSSTQHAATSVMTVADEYIVPIALGTGSGSHWPTLTGTTIHLKVGTTLTFRNDDNTAHLIHADGNTGIAHENPVGGGLPPGESYSQIPDATGPAHISCHLHGHTDVFTISVE